MFDCIIIGSGPAGVSASLYLKRGGLNILVLSNGSKALKNAHINNYYGFLDSSGESLYEIGIKQLDKNSILHKEEEVITILNEDKFIVKTTLSSYETKRIILAIGSSKKLDEKFKKYLGNGVSLCAHCDAPLYKNRKIYYSGISPYKEEIYKELSLYSKDIEEIEFNDSLTLYGDFFLEGVIVNGVDTKLDNLFLALPLTQVSLLQTLGVMLDLKDYVKVDEKYMTNINGVYAIGDMIDGVHQVASSVYQGMMCALKIIEEYKNA